jgi:hypothetical protein
MTALSLGPVAWDLIQLMLAYPFILFSSYPVILIMIHNVIFIDQTVYRPAINPAVFGGFGYIPVKLA